MFPSLKRPFTINSWNETLVFKCQITRVLIQRVAVIYTIIDKACQVIEQNIMSETRLINSPQLHSAMAYFD